MAFFRLAQTFEKSITANNRGFSGSVPKSSLRPRPERFQIFAACSEILQKQSRGMFTSRTYLLVALVCIALTVKSVSAQVLLAVDFNLSSNPDSLTETGFSGFGLSSSGGSSSGNTTPQTFGAYTVALLTGVTSGDSTAGLPTGRYRTALTDSGAFTYNHLYEDLAGQLARTTSATPATTAAGLSAFSISGLAANTQYSIQIWAMDATQNNGVVSAFYDTTVGTGASATLIGNTITNSNSPVLTDNNAYSTSGLVRSDENGVLRIGVTVTSGTGILNGFAISAVPEPSSLAALGLALLIFLGLSRCRRARLS